MPRGCPGVGGWALLELIDALAKHIRQLWRIPSDKVMVELVILLDITQESFLQNLSMR